MMNSGYCQTITPPPQLVQPPPQLVQPPPQLVQPPPQTICMPPPPQQCCPAPPPPPIIVEKPVVVDRPVYPPPQKHGKTKVVVIDRPQSQPPAAAAPIIISKESRSDDGCCKWCPGLFGLLGLLGLLCCLLHLFKDKDPEPVPPPAPVPVPKPDPIIPDTIDPTPVAPPVTPIKPEEMDPIRGHPVGLKDCDETKIGSVVDPNTADLTGDRIPETYVEPHSTEPTVTDPHVAPLRSTGTIRARPVSTNLTRNVETVSPYVTDAIEVRRTVEPISAVPVHHNHMLKASNAAPAA